MYTFKRGTIIMADFSPQVGSEIKGKHFAIVLTKRDRNSNELLTVIPLTSKEHKFHLDLGDEIKNTIYTRLIHTQQLRKIEPSSDCEIVKSSSDMDENADLYHKVITRYASLKVHTYAKVHQITTISKYRILKPVNKLDPIRQLVVSNEVMDKIDKKIVALFLRVDID